MQSRELIEDGIYILELEGDIDLAASPELRNLLAGYSKAKRPALILDFSQVKYVDSSGLATLIEHVRNIQEFKGKFAIAALTPRVRSVFELVRLDDFLSIAPTVADAKRKLEG